MTVEEKREYNQRRTESFRKRRLEEEILLSTPAGRISAEALQKVRFFVVYDVLFHMYYCLSKLYFRRNRL